MAPVINACLHGCIASNQLVKVVDAYLACSLSAVVVFGSCIIIESFPCVSTLRDWQSHCVAYPIQEMFEQQNIAFGYFLRPDAAPEERVYQELPADPAQLAPLLENCLDAYNNRFNTNLKLGQSCVLRLLLQ